MPISVGILTVSDRCSRGEEQDVSGPLIANLISRKKNEGIAEEPWGIPPRIEDGFGSHLGWVSQLLAVRMVDAQDHEPGVEIIGHILSGLWHRMDTNKVPGLTEIFTKPSVQFLRHFVRIALELFGPILG